MEMKQDFREFMTEGLGKRTHKVMKVSNSFGVYDIYKFIRKNHWYDIGRPVKEKEFYAIIRSINKYLAENIANGETVVFPHKMGKLELRKHEQGVSFVDGKLKNNYPINWIKTWKLWYEDAEARRLKILIRDDERHVYRVVYCKDKATYENKTFYQFVLNRFIKKALKEKIKQGKTDTLYGEGN